MSKIGIGDRLTNIRGILKKRRFLFLSFILFISFASIFSWFYLFSEEPSTLILDKTVLRGIMDEIPDDKENAVVKSEEVILGYYNVPKDRFDEYFSLADVTKTQYKWIITYNVLENPDLIVLLIKKISPEEGFEIADKFVIDNVGQEYFRKHFQKRSFGDYIARYSYIATNSTSYNPINMWIRLDDERNIVRHRVLLIPQEIRISIEKAQQICKGYGIPEPTSISLVLVEGRLNWRCKWQHQPTEEDYAQQRVYGIDIDATTGEILRTHKYSKPSRKPIQKSQINSLAQKINEFKELEDGAVINVRISSSFSEGFTITKSFGRLISKDGLSDDPDITIWMNRDAFLKAVESTNPMSILIEESEVGRVIVTPEKNLIILAKKGYTTLYEEFKKE